MSDGIFKRTPGLVKLMDELEQKIKAQNEMLMEHLERCIVLGQPTAVLIKWDAKKQEIVMKLVRTT